MKLPAPVRRLAKQVYCFGNSRYCNVCGRSSRLFLPAGVRSRPDARCPRCNSYERHRLVWHYFKYCTDLFDRRPKRMLHIAPESCFEPQLRQALGEGYVTADLLNPRVDHQWDVTAIPQPEGSFDVVYCSHVLEHVPDDRRAIAEFYRVLKPGGWAILNVPIATTITEEDLSITDPQERLRRYGQDDHVRNYGRDYIDRLRDAGFRVTEVQPEELFDERERTRQGVARNAGEIFYCVK